MATGQGKITFKAIEKYRYAASEKLYRNTLKWISTVLLIIVLENVTCN